jgi:GAF domain-containing protein
MAMREYSLADQMARISQELLARAEPEQTLELVVARAREAVPGCDFAGISLRMHNGRIATPAFTDPVVQRADDLQYDFAEGPCLDAIWVDDTYVIDDLQHDRRWPQWAPRAAELGLRSTLSVRLSTPDELVGGLNLYSAQVSAFDDDSVVIAHIYAAHASGAIAASTEVGNLNTALHSRHLIGVAQGLLMQRYGLSEEAAFQVLSRHSQDSNIKLRDVAAQLVAEFRTRGRLA